jgi:hypothetical protein
MKLLSITEARKRALAAAKDNEVVLDINDLKDDTEYFMVEHGQEWLDDETIASDYARARKAIDSKPGSFWKQ